TPLFATRSRGLVGRPGEGGYRLADSPCPRMITPTLVQNLEHDVTLYLLGGVETSGKVLRLLFVLTDGFVDHEGHDVVDVAVGAQRLDGLFGRIERLK